MAGFATTFLSPFLGLVAALLSFNWFVVFKIEFPLFDSSFNKMFTGKYNNYIQCLYVDCRREIEESFNEIQLTVKGYKNLYESFVL